VDDPYRSYVVRVRRRPNAPDSLWIEVEDLLGGRRSTVRGRPAEELSDELKTAVDAAATGLVLDEAASITGDGLHRPDAPSAGDTEEV
jgi:hypothetical protein